MIVHLNWLDYAERLFGAADWTNAASIAALYHQAQRLLPSDLVILPAVRLAEAHAGASADLRAAMTTRPSGAQPLRALLSSQALRTTIAATLTRLDAGAWATLALGIPAPETFAAAAAARGAGLALQPANEDVADDAAVYVADFLRAFAAAPITALRLGETAFAGVDAPVVRVAAHYGWEVLRDADVAVTVIPPGTRPEDALALATRLRKTA